MKDGPIVRKSFDFALATIRFCDLLFEKRQFVLANQLLKSGTSIGANVFEAQYAESRSDFIHKMKIAAKEACEAYYWLRLLAKLEEFQVREDLITEIKEIMAILAAIIHASKKNSP